MSLDFGSAERSERVPADGVAMSQTRDPDEALRQFSHIGYGEAVADSVRQGLPHMFGARLTAHGDSETAQTTKTVIDVSVNNNVNTVAASRYYSRIIARSSQLSGSPATGRYFSLSARNRRPFERHCFCRHVAKRK